MRSCSIQCAVLSFGGTNGATLDDLWALRFESSVPEEACHAGFDGDEDDLLGCADLDCNGYCDPLCAPLGICSGTRTLVEEPVSKDPTALGVPTQFRAELMAVVARVRRADGDEAGAIDAADDADGLRVAEGLEGEFSLAKLRAWRDKPSVPPRPARRRS